MINLETEQSDKLDEWIEGFNRDINCDKHSLAMLKSYVSPDGSAAQAALNKAISKLENSIKEGWNESRESRTW